MADQLPLILESGRARANALFRHLGHWRILLLYPDENLKEDKDFRRRGVVASLARTLMLSLSRRSLVLRQCYYVTSRRLVAASVSERSPLAHARGYTSRIFRVAILGRGRLSGPKHRQSERGHAAGGDA